MPAHPCPPRLLPWADSPEEIAARLRGCPGFVWLDTAGHRPGQDADGGLSLLTAFPSQILKGSIADPAPLENALETLRHADSGAASADWGFPLAGLFGGIDYDGEYTFGLYPEVLAYRHASRQWFATGPRLPALASPGPLNANIFSVVPESPPPGPENPGFHNETTPDHYQDLVARAQEYIAAGDIYQVNLTHRFTAPWPVGADAFPLALRLRAASPAPYAAFIDLDGRQILSSSPESFLRISGRHIRTRPIKGTRPRFHDSAADERSAIELMRSDKERAELLMITDLLRNDLGKVCEFGSVRVTDLLKLEPFEQVFHLVSTIEGRLRDNISPVAALAACFPGGSITGAPKKRAM
ncbi:MAG: pabB, partial [Verrucomicrobiales bacterium]|nr:pabB [Verrucomicrobiales bacterium]